MKEQFREVHMLTTLGHGDDGQTIAHPSVSDTISSSTLLTENKERTSSELLVSQYEKTSSLLETRKNAAPVASTSVTSSISHVAAAFKRNGKSNPTHDVNGNLAWILARQYQAYKNDDPKVIPEKAIPLCVISLVALKTSTERQRAITQLTIGAFYFAMRSCE